jgi:hypothetical protein
MGEHKRPVDQMLDLFVFAPLGLALAARDELPQLIERGRTQVTGQVALAKMFGQFAVTQGQQELKKRADQVLSQVAGARPASPPRPAAPAAPRQPAPAPGAPRQPAPAPAQPGPSASAAPTQPASNGHGGGVGVTASAFPAPAPQGPPPSESDDHLAIPGYDTLSASQVVQRLAGLSPTELEAVRRYESSTRARRTILSKVAQLQAGPAPGQ